VARLDLKARIDSECSYDSEWEEDTSSVYGWESDKQLMDSDLPCSSNAVITQEEEHSSEQRVECRIPCY
jgi:hypothetical protein